MGCAHAACQNGVGPEMLVEQSGKEGGATCSQQGPEFEIEIPGLAKHIGSVGAKTMFPTSTSTADQKLGGRRTDTSASAAATRVAAETLLPEPAASVPAREVPKAQSPSQPSMSPECSLRQRQIREHCKHELIREIGAGTFSSVWVATERGGESIKKFAVKVLELEDCNAVAVAYSTKSTASTLTQSSHATTAASAAGKANSGKYKSSWKIVDKEMTMLRSVSGKAHCLKAFDMYEAGGYAFIVSELCDMSFLEFLESHGSNLNPVVYQLAFYQMLSALDQIHQLSIVHRDVKPDNCLVNVVNLDGSRNLPDFEVKLCDFGLATWVNDDKPAKGICGTAPFMSPEMLLKTGYNEKTDVWSMGALMYVLMYGLFPYMPRGASPSPTLMRDAIMSNASTAIDYNPRSYKDKSRPMTPPPRVFGESESLLKACLIRDPATRTTAAVAMTHGWLAQYEESEPHDFQPAVKSAKAIGAFNLKAAAKWQR